MAREDSWLKAGRWGDAWLRGNKYYTYWLKNYKIIAQHLVAILV